MSNQTNHSTSRSGARTARSGCSGPQALILLVVAVLGMVCVALLVRALFPANPQSVGLSEAGIPTPQETLLPQVTPTAVVPTPPADCARLNNGAWLATAVRVVDSSTIEVDVEGARVLVGYAGVSLPQAGPYSTRAIDEIQALLSEGPLVLVRDHSEEDNGGRLMRYIFAGERFLNLELIQQGLAEANLQGPDKACAAVFQQAELDARAKKVGLWELARIPTATFIPPVNVSPALPESCVCSSLPTCADFQTHDDAQACFNACNDYNSRLDEDHDGIACEALP